MAAIAAIPVSAGLIVDTPHWPGLGGLTQAILDSMVGSMCVLDLSGVILAVNRAWVDFGRDNGLLTPCAAVGANYLDVCRRDRSALARKVAAGLSAVLAGERTLFICNYPCHAPTQQRWFEMRALRADAEGATYVVVMHHPITPLKNIELRLRKRNQSLKALAAIARAATQAKTAVLSTVSHEIRTPLNGILGMAQAMVQDPLSPEQATRLEVIRAAADGMLVLLNDLLDIAKIEAGKIEIQNGPVNLSAIVASVCDSFSFSAQAKGISLDFTITDTVPLVQTGDAHRIRQILVNLVSNAVKFTALGGVRISVDYENEMSVLRVTDSGPGIAPEDQARLFTSFVQAGEAAKGNFGGTGLGLAISRDLARLMGGDITLESRLGDGAVFTARLSLQPSDSGEAPHQDTEPVAIELANLHILAVDDNATNRLVLSTLLGQLGFTVELADGGQAAVTAWQEATWDIILMDIEMPVVDGLAATRLIRQREVISGRRRTPIIAVTANAMTHQVASYSLAGVDAVVAKPIKLEQLLLTIERTLNAARGH